jgi:NADH-quinone oxidoreductase subunit G
VLKRFAELIKQNGLENEVVLSGSFCMERCGEGMNWRVGDDDVSSPSVAGAEAEFRRRLIDVPEKA